MAFEILNDEEFSSLEKNVVERNLLCSDALHQYILNTNVYPREHAQLKELREETMKLPGGLRVLSTPPEQGQLLSLLLKLMNAKKTIEIGVFTGYSVLTTALALPKDGKVVAIDINKSYYDIGLPFIQKAGVEDKIDFIESQGLPVLDKLVQEVGEDDLFDFAFIDADKGNYGEYHERLLKLVKVGGLIAYDNTLWSSTVAVPENPAHPMLIRKGRNFIVKFNEALASDSRIQVSQLCIGDGMTLCIRLS